MLNKKQIDLIAGLLRIESDKIADAIKNEKEISLTIPDGILAFTPDELLQRDNNAIEKAKPGIKLAAVEEALKVKSTALGLNLGGTEKRDLDAFTKAIQDKAIEDAKIAPDKKVEELKKELVRKDELIQATILEKTTLQNSFNAFKDSANVERIALGSLTDGKVLNRNQKLVLFNSEFRVENSDAGMKVINVKTGKVMEDEKLNPLTLETVVTEFNKKFPDEINTEGRGEQFRSNLQNSEEAKKMDDIKKQAVSEGLAVGSVEYWNRINELLPKK